jgi:putative transcriptional regulator
MPDRSRRAKLATTPPPEAIRAARVAAGLTQRAAADIIHASVRGWEDWEAGRRRMHAAFFELFIIKTSKHHPWRAIKEGIHEVESHRI